MGLECKHASCRCVTRPLVVVILVVVVVVVVAVVVAVLVLLFMVLIVLVYIVHARRTAAVYAVIVPDQPWAEVHQVCSIQ